MDSSHCVVRLKGLCVERDVVILDRVDWCVNSGEHWVILGANGSGKTSLLSALTAYLTPSAGEIFVCGETFGRTDWRELRKSIGLVSSSIRQMIGDNERAIDVVLSGKDAVINLWEEVDDEERKRGEAILQQIECEHLARRFWRHLSQGERQRVLIGRALMSDLKLLILDEPCAGLDPVAREAFLAFIDRLTLHGQDPTIIFVTHHVEEITPGFSHALLLKSGKVLAAGARESVLNSGLLSEAFSAEVHLRQEKKRYFLDVKGGVDIFS